MSKLYKKDAVIVIYQEDPEFDCLVLHIGKKDPNSKIKVSGNYYGAWKDFDDELEQLDITESEDEWQYWGSLNRTQLRDELRKRKFKAEFSEDVGYESYPMESTTDMLSVFMDKRKKLLLEEYLIEGLGHLDVIGVDIQTIVDSGSLGTRITLSFKSNSNSSMQTFFVSRELDWQILKTNYDVKMGTGLLDGINNLLRQYKGVLRSDRIDTIIS